MTEISVGVDASLRRLSADTLVRKRSTRRLKNRGTTMDEKKMDTDLTDLDIYQNWVTTMHQFTSNDTAKELMWMALGLSAEAGEVAGEVEKVLRRKGEIDNDNADFLDAMSSELGDVLFWVASICSKLDISMDLVLMANMSKLNARKPV